MNVIPLLQILRGMLISGALSPWLMLPLSISATSAAASRPILHTELIFPLESWHNHASCIVEAPNGDLIVCWFHGSGERTADDVRIEGARKPKGQRAWSQRFVMADSPDYPDTNCAMFVDPQGRLWLLYPTILANRWETALMKYRISSDYTRSGPPKWDVSEVLHFTPGPEFQSMALQYIEKAQAQIQAQNLPAKERSELEDYFRILRERATDKLSQRLGWMTRSHPIVIAGGRLIVPLYSDGFDGSIMAITDDGGKTWRASTPLFGGANIQPSVVQRRDGSLYTLMRDNGPPPHRLHQSESRDRGQTWSPVTDSAIPNPGSGSEIISLRNGHWVFIGNDTEKERHQLAVMISADEGRTWPWKRYLERDEPGPEAGRYHYPSIIEGQDGMLHATYSYHLRKRALPQNAAGESASKSIKYARFNEAWVIEGDKASSR